MDYMGEELLRQQAALWALVSGADVSAGGSRAEPDEHMHEETIWTSENETIRRAISASRLSSRLRMGGGMPGERPVTDLWEDGENGRETAETFQGEPLSIQQRFREEAGSSSDRLPVDTATEVTWAGSGEEWDPKRISRVFQRDARRYDGAFSTDGKGE